MVFARFRFETTTKRTSTSARLSASRRPILTFRRRNLWFRLATFARESYFCRCLSSLANETKTSRRRMWMWLQMKPEFARKPNVLHICFVLRFRGISNGSARRDFVVFQLGKMQSMLSDDSAARIFRDSNKKPSNAQYPAPAWLHGTHGHSDE